MSRKNSEKCKVTTFPSHLSCQTFLSGISLMPGTGSSLLWHTGDNSRMLTAQFVLLTHRQMNVFIVHLVLIRGHGDYPIASARKIILVQFVLDMKWHLRCILYILLYIISKQSCCSDFSLCVTIKERQTSSAFPEFKVCIYTYVDLCTFASVIGLRFLARLSNLMVSNGQT